MEFPSSGAAHRLTVEEFDTARHLAHAAKQARERGFDKLTIVDADIHHEEGTSVRAMLKYIDSPVERFLARRSCFSTLMVDYAAVLSTPPGTRPRPAPCGPRCQMGANRRSDVRRTRGLPERGLLRGREGRAGELHDVRRL